jgi:hypothetical protein
MILYHYCPTKSFLGILESQEIRLSALPLSNDRVEGRWAIEILNNLKNSLSQSTTATIKGTLNKVVALARIYAHSIDGLGLCLSEDGDKLGQWRAYADDGNGVSIGFRKEALEKVEEINPEDLGPDVPWFHLLQVDYDEQSQRQRLLPLFDAIMETIERSESKLRQMRRWDLVESLDSLTQNDWLQAHYDFGFFELTSHLFLNLYRLKNPTFAEEKEWRVMSYLGTSLCQYSSDLGARNQSLVAFRKINLKELEHPAIVELILGPKNKTPIEHLIRYLASRGLSHIAISRSRSTYQ